jgi:hypothetical protein
MSPSPPKLLKKIRQFFAWSFSRYCDYRECPAKAAYKHIDHLEQFDKDEAETTKLVKLVSKGKPMPSGIPAFTKGSVVHEIAELYVNGKIKKLPEELETFAKEFKHLKTKKTSEEQQWAFTVDWVPCSWFAQEAWLRVMVDEHYADGAGRYTIIDYKTGKAPSAPGSKTPSWNNEKFYQHREQREIYAIAVFIMYPDAEVVTAKHWYLDAGVEHVDTYERKTSFKALKDKWTKTVVPMFADRKFAPRPSQSACKFCSFKKAEGGPCKF